MAIDQVDWTVGTQGPRVVAGQETVRTGSPRITGNDARRLMVVSKRRPLALLFRGLIAFALLAAGSLITISPASAASSVTIAPATTCNNGVGNAGGEGLICEVTVVNKITASAGSATVTVRECLGSAGDPTDGARGHPCTTTTTALTQAVTAVTQCNASISGGGGTLRCSVKVTNNFISVSPGSTAATVNQCVGSGASGIFGQTIKCDPFPATTTGAAITQCNGSANGGSLVGLTCTATGTMASAHAVTINQCNGSANGGGALVICSASVVNAASATASAAASAVASSSASSGASSSASSGASSSASSGASLGANSSTTPATTSTTSDLPSGDSTPLLALLICLAFGGLGVAAVEVQRRRLRR